MTGWRSLLIAACLCATPALADVWDLQTDNDDDRGTENELAHGTAQVHDLGVRPGPLADGDWYRMPQKPHASYEVIVDGVSGDLAPGLELARIAADGTTVLETAGDVVTGAQGGSRALRWLNSTTSTAAELVRVSGGSCGTACGGDDVYAIRARETTLSIPRFANGGTQMTVFVTQNVSERPVNAIAFFWNSSGTPLAAQPFALQSKAQFVLNVGTILNPSDSSGHITVVHDGGYGALNTKAITLEPSTGFSFDVVGTHLP